MRKTQARNEYDKTIQETEVGELFRADAPIGAYTCGSQKDPFIHATFSVFQAAYMKILESSQTLLHVLKRETVNLSKKKQGSD